MLNVVKIPLTYIIFAIYLVQSWRGSGMFVYGKQCWQELLWVTETVKTCANKCPVCEGLNR